MDTPLIRIRDLCKSYTRGDQTIPVLAGITLDIAKGEFLAWSARRVRKIHPPKPHRRIDTADSGRILVGDTDVVALSEGELADWRSAHVGFISSSTTSSRAHGPGKRGTAPAPDPPLPRRTPRARRPRPGRREPLRPHGPPPGPALGGQQQRVAIARAIVARPDILVADEPTGDLDRASAEDILHLMDGLNTELGKTIIMVTHDQRAADAAHLILRLDKGELHVSD
jgi:putative ABC transport system ATP-binding protein